VDPSPATASVQQVMTAAGMNALRDQITFLANRPRFKGTITAGGVLPAVTNIAWPAVEDPYGGWDATNHWWVVPAGCGGLYRAEIQFKWNGAPSGNVAIGLIGGAAGATSLARSPNPSALVAGGGISLNVLERLNAGDRIGVQPVNAGFSALGETLDNNFFCLTWESD
jgi:hypothetical protein